MSNVFKLTDDDKGLITRKSTRVAAPSIYLDQVKAAASDGDVYGIYITTEETVSTILNNLKKAEKELDLKLKVWSRPEAKPKPFVGFQVKPATPATNEAVAPLTSGTEA